MRRIFIVEDDQDIRELIEFVLVNENYETETFPTAEEFQLRIDQEKPDLILLDIKLPDGNGIGICKNLSKNPKTMDIPVVLMSAHANVDVNKQIGAKDFLAKPFGLEDLLSKVRKQLN